MNLTHQEALGHSGGDRTKQTAKEDTETMNVNSICVQGGYTPGNGEPRQIPISSLVSYLNVVL